MSERITESFDTKQIHELNPLAKLSGKEEVLIDNGNGTLRVTVDTLLGYIRDQINAASGSGESPSTTTGGSTIHIIHEDEPDIPIESRSEGHYYIRVVNAVDAQLSTGLPRLIRVSPNMRLRLIQE